MRNSPFKQRELRAQPVSHIISLGRNWELVTDSQRVTWAAFAIIAMFLSLIKTATESWKISLSKIFQTSVACWHSGPLSPLLLMRGNNSRLKLGHSLGAVPAASCELRRLSRQKAASVALALSPPFACHAQAPFYCGNEPPPPPPSAVSYLICGSEQWDHPPSFCKVIPVGGGSGGDILWREDYFDIWYILVLKMKHFVFQKQFILF